MRFATCFFPTTTIATPPPQIGIGMMSVIVGAPGKFLHLLFPYIQLTFYLFLGTALLVMMLQPHCCEPLLMGWLMEQQ